jgi:hypothetical protein
MGADVLVDQARLAHTRFPDEGDDLTMPGAGLCQGLLQDYHLLVPSDKARQAPRCSCLQARPHHASARHLIDLYRVAQAADGHGSQRLHLHEALDQPQHRWRDEDRPRHGHLLHAGRQVRGLPHRRVVHVQVAAD